MAATDARAGRRRFRRAAGWMAMVATLAALAGARADERGSAGVSVYADDDQLTVVHPAAAATAEVADGWRIDAGYEADVISAATVDVRTSASPRGFDETRHGMDVGLSHEVSRTLQISTGYALSLSPDYRSNAASARIEIEDDDRHHTVSLAAGVARDRVGRAGDAEWSGSILSLGGSVMWTTVLSRSLVLDLALALEARRGYMESPYRFVPVTDATGQSSVAVPERVPDARRRGSGRVRLRWAVADRVFVRGWWRVHLDDWGVVGHTVETTWVVEPADDWLVSLGGRFYGQHGASFYDGSYATLPELPRWRTLDRELATSWYVAGGGRVRWTFGEWLDGDWHLNVRIEGRRTRFIHTPRLPRRRALIVGAGLVIER